MQPTTKNKRAILPYEASIALLVSIIFSVYVYSDGLNNIIERWLSEDEYSHGPLLVFLSLFFCYQKKELILSESVVNRGLGPLIILIASLIFFAGEISSLFILVHYAFIATGIGFFICLYGTKACRHIFSPLILLVFAIPIPYFLQTELTINLQLASSWIGVAIIKLFSIPAYLEGNIIDLGILQLQVVEACAGLRYMFSLLSFGYICAYVYRVEMWKRTVVFLSTIPITLLMNSFRIAMVGILVNQFGVKMAEGFTHNFQGVAVFSLCLLILFIEMWLLTKVGNKASFRQVFGFDFNVDKRRKHPPTEHPITLPFVLGITTLAFTFLLVNGLSNRTELIPDRTPLISFPSQIENWQGISHKIDQDTINKLQFSDYLSADYRLKDSPVPVNLYIAYYETQRKGASPHSPRVCIPGGGWEITNISRQTALLGQANTPLLFNRALIKKGRNTQLVYYWFQQRGRSIANEYLMKWYLFTDAITKNRSDGALVRLVTPLITGEDIEAADQRLLKFADEISGLMSDYIPN